jgi:hypothetical protein
MKLNDTFAVFFRQIYPHTLICIFYFSQYVLSAAENFVSLKAI